MSNVIKFHRLTALPQTFEPNSIYVISRPNENTYAEIYITGLTGNVVRRLPNKEDIENLILSYISNANELYIVDTITDRNNLNLNKNAFVLVLDASADPTVDTGSALYVYRVSTGEWIKVAEYESMDVVITWDKIQEKPTSSPQDIDDAVAKRHMHSNLTQLNKIGEDANGNFMYNNQYPVIVWNTAEW
ncbi:MAG: hypothetical protein QXX12_01860 [Nanopusillaceae archaeon]